MLMASNSINSSSESFVFPTFLYLLELFAETMDDSKLHAVGQREDADANALGGTGGKLTSIFNILAHNMLQRRAFRFMRMSNSNGTVNPPQDWISVFDEEELIHGGLSDIGVLWWLRQAGALFLPHAHIPTVLMFLENCALTHPELVLLDANSSGRLWRASDIEEVLYAVVSYFSLAPNCPALSSRTDASRECIALLAQRLPALYFAEPLPPQLHSEYGAILETHLEGLQCLYSSHNASLLRDTNSEIVGHLTVLWSTLRPAELSSETQPKSPDFAEMYGTAHAKVYTVLEYFLETSLVPLVLSADDFFALCAAVTGEDASTYGEGSVLSQARLFEVLYLVAHNFWNTLESMRRKRPAGSSAIRLSTKQPQRAQQILQTFLYLLAFDFAPPVVADAAPIRPVDVSHVTKNSAETIESHTAVAPEPEPESAPRPSGIPVFVPRPSVAAIPPALPSPTTPLREASTALAVSFNSNKLIHNAAPMDHTHDSFFSNHPLRDIAVLLVHFPVSSFQLSPWAVLQLLANSPLGTEVDSPSLKGIAAGGASASALVSDRMLTDLLVRFCKQYDVSSDRLTEFFALYYLTDENTAQLAGASPDKGKGSFALFKEQALRNKVMDFIMDEQALRLLIHNADLLKWEYVRCLSLFRASNNPFTEGILSPLASSLSLAQFPTSALLPRTNAIKWALDVAQISKERAETHLQELSCLAGSITQALSLTFSSFVVFAIRCFADPILFTPTSTEPCKEADFVSAIRTMLQSFSQSLSHVQQSLRMKVLKPLFGGPVDYSKEPLGEQEMATILSSSLKLFSSLSPAAPAIPAVPAGATATPAMKGATPGDGRIPPRPPAIFWDAPRFVQYCRDVSILAQCRWSITLGWSAYGYYLREQASPGVELWEQSVVSPVPIKSTLEATRQLIDSILVPAELQSDATQSLQDFPSTVGMYYKTLVPMLCVNAASTAGDTALSPAKPAVVAEGLKLEDFLRYGGSAMAESLAASQPFLRDVYLTLLNKAATTLLDGAGSVLSKSTNPAKNDTTLGLRGLEQCGEVPLNLLCAFFSCENLLRTSAVAVQAKRSLHARVRPSYYSRKGAPGATPLEEVTLSYVEFEELFIRAAFLLWEASSAHINANNHANKSGLLSQPHLLSKNAPEISPDTTAVAELYCRACADRSDELKKLKAAATQKRASWGIDFLQPFATVLRAITEISPVVQHYVVTVKTDTVSNGAPQFDKPVVVTREKRAKGAHVRFSEEVMVSTLRDEGSSLTDIFTSRLNYSVADPAVRRGEGGISAPPAHVNRLVSGNSDPGSSAPPRAHRRTGSGGSLTGSPPTGLLDRRGRPHIPLESNSSTHDPEREQNSRESSPSPRLQTSQQVILSSSERFLQMQESTQQFVVALDTLLVGTKEALWPVYATYCSCGDSLDPGKLSGPNLFTLLSKLGVLTDRTLLSDVGILLHQTAVHSLSSSPLDAIASLYASGDYYESPSLTFEEFIVFLCAFSQLRFEGVMLTPEMFNRQVSQRYSTSNGALSPTPENWFKQWQEYMGSSTSFRRLLVECVLPILQKQMLLAFPEDARLRDRFCYVFSLEVLLAVEGVEGPLLSFFEHERTKSSSLLAAPSSASAVASSSGPRGASPLTVSAKDEVEISAIVTALKRINLIPRVMEESQVLQLIKDVLPEGASRRRSAASSSAAGSAPPNQKDYVLFPQWEWVLSVVAFQAVETAMLQSTDNVDTKVKKNLRYHTSLWCSSF